MDPLPRTRLTEHATQVGTALEVILLSLALAGRLQHERRLREQAQAEAIVMERHANEQLEQRVAERTRELEEANRLLEQLSRTDALTGVNNRRSIIELGRAEWQRAKRYSQPATVLVFDVDHFKSINDDFGHAKGDEVLQAITATVIDMMRQTDALGRIDPAAEAAMTPTRYEPCSAAKTKLAMLSPLTSVSTMANEVPGYWPATVLRALANA